MNVRKHNHRWSSCGSLNPWSQADGSASENKSREENKWTSHIHVCKVKVKVQSKWPTVVASVMRIAFLIAESMQRWFVCLCRPAVKGHQGQGHRYEHEHKYGIHKSTVTPSLNVTAEILQAKTKSHLRHTCDLEWRSTSMVQQPNIMTKSASACRGG